MERSNFIKSVMLPTLVILISIVVVIFVLSPSLSVISQSRRDLAEINTRIEKYSAKIAVLNSVDQSKLRGLLEPASAAMPSEKNVPGLLSGLERAAQVASASIDGFSISPGKVSTSSAASASAMVATSKEKELGFGLKAVPFKAVLKGGYLSLREFIATLYKSNRLIGVDAVNLTGGKYGNNEVVTSLDLYLYYQPQPTNLGTVDSEVTGLTAEQLKSIETISVYPIFTASPPMVPTGKSNPFTR